MTISTYIFLVSTDFSSFETLIICIIFLYIIFLISHPIEIWEQKTKCSRSLLLFGCSLAFVVEVFLPWIFHPQYMVFFLTASLIKKSLSWIFSVQAKEIKIDSYRLKEKERRKKTSKPKSSSDLFIPLRLYTRWWWFNGTPTFHFAY